MDYHIFNTEVAKITGVNAAVIFDFIQKWCDVSRAKKENFHDGRYWTDLTLKYLVSQFPYLTRGNITSALKSLKSNGLIDSMELNKNHLNRTRFYCDLTKEKENGNN